MKMTIFEGTPAELLEIHRSLSEQANTTLQGSQSGAGVADGPVQADAHGWASTETAYLALTRIPLSKEQRRVLVTIYKAHPDWVLATTLQNAVGYSASQFAGLMGAFGRRFTHTDGFEDGQWFFDQIWNYDEGCVQYRFPDSVRKAIEKARLV